MSTGPEASGFSTVVADQHFIQPAYFIRECIRCGLLYRSVTLSATALADYYRRVDFRQWETNGYYPTERIVHRTLHSLCRGAKVLDVGCSSGRLLSAFVSEYECYGVEINRHAAARAVSKGLKVLDQDMLDIEHRQSFDAVVLVDVFEHLVSPTAFLKKLLILLKPGGLLILATGNADARACRRDPAQFWYFRTPSHLCMFSRRYADYLAENLRLTIMCWQETSHYDFRLADCLRQWVTDQAYWATRTSGSWNRRILKTFPYLRKACDWTVAPGFACTRDHVVVTFRPL